jgi:RimJ/RimL family protein N-acetyltransferase
VSDLRQHETARMRGEPLGPEHAAELAPYLADPRWAASLSPTGRPPAAGGTAAELQVKAAHWSEHGFGLWLLRDRLDPRHPMVGRGGLQHTDIEGGDEVEIAWAIVPERWREGLATELATACVEIAFTALGLDHVIAITTPDNVASRRVMEKVGMRFERNFAKTFDGIELPMVLYARTR